MGRVISLSFFSFLSIFPPFFFLFYTLFFSLSLALSCSLAYTLCRSQHTQSPSISSLLRLCNVPTTNCLIVIPLQFHCGLLLLILTTTTPLLLQSYCNHASTTSPTPTSINVHTLTATLLSLIFLLFLNDSSAPIC